MNKIIKHSINEDIQDKIMNLFWQKGISATSVDDIVTESGMNRATLYKYYGDKEGLFNEMLQRYINKVSEELLTPLKKETASLDALVEFFNQFKSVTHVLYRKGCFVVNTSINHHAHNHDIKCLTTNFLTQLSQYFKACLERAREKKRINEQVNIDKAAGFLVGNTYGLMTLLRSQVPFELVINHIESLTDYIYSLC